MQGVPTQQQDAYAGFEMSADGNGLWLVTSARTGDTWMDVNTLGSKSEPSWARGTRVNNLTFPCTKPDKPQATVTFD